MLKGKGIGSELITMLAVSVIFHACVVLGFSLYARFSTKINKPKDNSLNFIWVSPKSSKALSKVNNKLPPPVVPPPKHKVKQKPKPKIVEKKKLSKIGKKDRTKKKKPKKESKKEAIAKALSEIYTDLGEKPQPKADNYSANDKAARELGAFLGGSGKGDSKMTREKLMYINTIREILTNNWHVINTALVRQLKDPIVILLIKLNSDGYIVSRKFEKKSGNSYYDKSVLRALNKSEPFPPPSVNLRDEVLLDGIVIEFDPPLN